MAFGWIFAFRSDMATGAMAPTVQLGVGGGGARGVAFLLVLVSAFAIVGGLGGVGIETGEFFEDSELWGIRGRLGHIGFMDGRGCGSTNVVGGWRWSGLGHGCFDGLEVGFDDVRLLGVAEVGGRDGVSLGLLSL